MPKPCRIFPVVIFLFTSCVTPNPKTGYVQIPAGFAGIVHAGETNTAEEYAYLDYLGTGWKLHTFYWSRIENEQGVWNFQQYDNLVDMGNNAGIKTLGILAYDNNWIHVNKKMQYYIPPEKLQDFLEYVRKTVEHFKGRVDAWCIWNEPNFQFWTGTKEEFFELSRRAADVIRQTDGDVIILGGAFNRGIFGLPKKYIRGLFESGAMEKADAIAFHPYELNPVRTAKLYDSFKKLILDYGFEEKIWVTEVGYPTGGLYPTKVSEKNYPAYIIKTFTLLAAGGAKKIFWYQLFDPETRKSTNSEDFFGLVRSRNDHSSKGAEAFRLCAVYLSGTVYQPQAPSAKPTAEVSRAPWLENLPKSISSYYFKGDGRNVLVLWKKRPGTKSVHLDLPGTGHISHDPVSGNSNALPQESQIKIGTMPVFITW